MAYVLSLNLHRRHLTPSQLAMVGARARDIYDRQAKERQKDSGKVHGRGKEKVPVNLPEPFKADARDLAGKAVGVSGKLVDYATKVIADAVPELVKVIGERLEALERPKAKARKTKGANQYTEPGGKLPQGSTGKTRDKVAAALGVSGRTYEKVKAVKAVAGADPVHIPCTIVGALSSGSATAISCVFRRTNESFSPNGPGMPTTVVRCVTSICVGAVIVNVRPSGMDTMNGANGLRYWIVRSST